MSSNDSWTHSRDVRDWYALLGLSDDASERDLDTAIERLSRQASALVNSAPERSQQLRDTVRAIRGDLLSGPEARRRYDERVLAMRRQPAPPSSADPSRDTQPPAYRYSPPSSNLPVIANGPSPVQHETTNRPDLPPPPADAFGPASSPPNFIDTMASNIVPMASRFRRFLKTGWTCPSCSAQGGPEDEFCKSCGAVMKTEAPVTRRTCPRCSAEVGNGDRFCARCGTSMP